MDSAKLKRIIGLIYFVLAIVSLFSAGKITDFSFHRFIFCLALCFFGLGLRAYLYYGIYKRDKSEVLDKKGMVNCIISYLYYLFLSSALVSFIYLANFRSFNKMGLGIFNFISFSLFSVSGLTITEFAEHFLLRKSGKD